MQGGSLGYYSFVLVEFSIVEGLFQVARLPVEVDVSRIAPTPRLFSMTFDADEITVVADESFTHPGAVAETGWKAIQLAGPFPFELTGVLASVLAPLGEAQVSIFALSTYSTDYVVVRESDLAKAVKTLIAAGHKLSPK